MKLPSSLLAAAALVAPAFSTFAEDSANPIFTNDFEAAEVGKAPADFMVMSGDFAVTAEGANKFLELPGAPLDTFGLLFGPTQKVGVSASARFFATNKGRKMPAFGISLNGVAGFRLQVSASKKELEIFRGDEGKKSVPFAWTPGVWTKLKIQVRAGEGGGVIVEGKAWPADAAEPAAWTISLEDEEAPPAGRAGIWGSPYAGTPIRFDDLSISPATAK